MVSWSRQFRYLKLIYNMSCFILAAKNFKSLKKTMNYRKLKIVNQCTIFKGFSSPNHFLKLFHKMYNNTCWWDKYKKSLQKNPRLLKRIHSSFPSTLTILTSCLEQSYTNCLNEELKSNGLKLNQLAYARWTRENWTNKVTRYLLIINNVRLRSLNKSHQGQV